jgi:hypothetical protein
VLGSNNRLVTSPGSYLYEITSLNPLHIPRARWFTKLFADREIVKIVRAFKLRGSTANLRKRGLINPPAPLPFELFVRSGFVVCFTKSSMLRVNHAIPAQFQGLLAQDASQATAWFRRDEQVGGEKIRVLSAIAGADGRFKVYEYEKKYRHNKPAHLRALNAFCVRICLAP